jgi:CheY-like chemotaxis protein
MTSTPFEHATRPRRILFAEDHEDVRRVVALLLEYDGYTVDCAENGAVALRLYEANPTAYDILITDHDMPQLDGIGLVQGLRRGNFNGCVIVISGGLTPALSAAYVELEVNHILPKPVTVSYLSELIEKISPQRRILVRGDFSGGQQEEFAA